MDGYLRRLFREAHEVIVKAWAPEEYSVVKYFTFEGRQMGGDLEGGDEVLAYGECGPKERFLGGSEQGKVVIGGLALRAIRHFLEAAGGATYVYVGVVIDIDREMPLGKEEIRVDTIEVRFSFSTSDHNAILEIQGLGNDTLLATEIIPPPGDWLVYRVHRGKLEYVDLNGRLKYVDLNEEVAIEMPVWLERALKEGGER